MDATPCEGSFERSGSLRYTDILLARGFCILNCWITSILCQPKPLLELLGASSLSKRWRLSVGTKKALGEGIQGAGPERARSTSKLNEPSRLEGWRQISAFL